MSTFQSVEEAREYFKGDRFAMQAGVKLVELGEDWCICSMKLNDTHKNAIGTVMGGAIFTLADFAFAVASNQVYNPTTAIQVSINYMSTAKGDILYANAKCRKDGRTTVLYNIDVYDSLGREVAQFIGTGFKLSKQV